jgi:hypothetical protein
MKYFIVKDLVPESIYNAYKENSIWFLDNRVINVAEKLVELSGEKITCNSWASGGSLQFCGFRPLNCAIGASYSQHKFGRALDLHIVGLSGKQMFELVLAYSSSLIPLGLTAIERGCSSWIHVDVRYTSLSGLFIFGNCK